MYFNVVVIRRRFVLARDSRNRTEGEDELQDMNLSRATPDQN